MGCSQQGELIGRKWEMTPDLKKGRRLADRSFPSSARPRGTSNIKAVGLDFLIGIKGD